MCGIVGYVGQKQALEIVVGGLRRLEYRGYDSAGVAVISAGQLVVRKKAGKLANLETFRKRRPEDFQTQAEALDAGLNRGGALG